MHKHHLIFIYIQGGEDFQSDKKKNTAKSLRRKNKMASLLLRILPFLFLSMMVPWKSDGQVVKQWCIADEQYPDEELQRDLDWACGSGRANCSAIQENQRCYYPNTVRDHASYAFNSYWQKFKNQGGSCKFNAAALLTELDPSHGSCIFEFVP